MLMALVVEVATKDNTVLVEHNTGIELGQNPVLVPGQVLGHGLHQQTITPGLEIITPQPQQGHMEIMVPTLTAHGLMERIVIGHIVLLAAGVPVTALVHGKWLTHLGGTKTTS
jgi:hypothetical protein